MLQAQERNEARQAYQAQLLWLIHAQLSALTGSGSTMPDYFTLFPAAQAAVHGEDIRRMVLKGLRGQVDGDSAMTTEKGSEPD